MSEWFPMVSTIRPLNLRTGPAIFIIFSSTSGLGLRGAGASPVAAPSFGAGRAAGPPAVAGRTGDPAAAEAMARASGGRRAAARDGPRSASSVNLAVVGVCVCVFFLPVFVGVGVVHV